MRYGDEGHGARSEAKNIFAANSGVLATLPLAREFGQDSLDVAMYSLRSALPGPERAVCAAERGQFGFATACGAKARGAGRPLLHGREGAPATPRHGASAIGGGARGPPSLATPPASAGRPRAAPWAGITSEAPSARRGHSVPEARKGRRARACSAADGRGTEIGARRWSSKRCSILPPRGLRALEAASPPLRRACEASDCGAGSAAAACRISWSAARRLRQARGGSWRRAGGERAQRPLDKADELIVTSASARGVAKPSGATEPRAPTERCANI